MALPIVEFKDRLYDAMSIRGYKQVDLCRRTGLSKSAIHNYITGYAKPKQDKLYIIAKALSVDEAWLMGFDVPMEKDSKELFEEKDLLTKENFDLLIRWGRLNNEQKALINSMIDQMLK